PFIQSERMVAVRAMRLWLLFLLDIIEIARGPGQGYDPLILGVVSSASVATVNQDIRLQLAYATVDRPPPDALRRPVSINAIARSLGLPYETVRRRVVTL